MTAYNDAADVALVAARVAFAAARAAAWAAARAAVYDAAIARAKGAA